jgi:hypothetical protein
MRGRWLISLLLLSAPAAWAYRVEFIATVDGERLAGAEICLFRGGEGDDPATRFLGSNDVRCLPADNVLDMPSGVWNFYARHSDGWVSAHGSSLIHRGPANVEKGYQSIGVALRRAATIVFPPGPAADRFAAYVPMVEGSTYSPAVFPLPAGEQRIVVPAGEPLVILRIRDGKPVAAGPLTTLEPMQTADAVALMPPAGRRDLIAWMRVDETTLRVIGNAEAPVVRLVDAQGAERAPLYRTRRAGPADGSLIIFPDPAPGRCTLRVAGPRWRTVATKLDLDPGAGEWFIEQPLVARLPQRVTVRWVLPDGLREIPGREHRCDESGQPGDAGAWTADLLTCPNWKPGARLQPPSSLSQCRIEQRLSLAATEHGSVDFDVAQPGHYLVSLTSARSRLGSAPVRVKKDEDAAVHVSLRMTTVFGRVTDGDTPLHAVVQFETGSALADRSGSYRAVLDADPLDNVIEIRPCDGSPPFQHIPKEQITGSRQYDIHIPKNEIDVRVVDGVTGAGIAGASVGRGIFPTKEDAARPDSLRDDAFTDDQGKTTLRRFEPGYFLRVCAVAERYQSGCADPIALRFDTRESVTLPLRRRAMHAGRVVSRMPLQLGMLYRTTRDGRIVEQVRVNDDGTFAFGGEQAADRIIVTAPRHPLFVIPHPPVTEDELTIAVPAGRVTGFTVEIADSLANRSAWFTIQVGDTIVPADVLAAHLTRRGMIAFVEDGGPARVGDVIESAPLAVIAALGRVVDGVPVPDLFVLPQYAGIRDVRAVPADGRVVFERR